MDASARDFFEPRFGRDFSSVRVHTGASANASARDVRSLAYTVGNNIVFAAGRFDQSSMEGRRLLAHELSHVVQQTDPSIEPAVRRAAIHDGRILDEGTCEFLVKNSRFICCDPDNGVDRPGRTKDIDGTDCPSSKFTPIFTCESTCGKALAAGCSDSDNWMAIPNSRFARKKCGQDLVICSGGASTHGRVRDRSDKEAWEVGRAIPGALGVSPDFNGVIYPSESDPGFKKDPRCHPKTTSLDGPGGFETVPGDEAVA